MDPRLSVLASHGLMSSRPFQCLPENASVQSQHLLACPTLARGWSGFRAPDPELSGIGIIHSSWTLGCQEWILGSQEWIQGSQEWILGCQGLELLTLVGQWAARSGSWTCRTCSTHSTRRTRRSLRARSAPRTYRTCRTRSAPSTPRKVQY